MCVRWYSISTNHGQAWFYLCAVFACKDVDISLYYPFTIKNAGALTDVASLSKAQIEIYLDQCWRYWTNIGLRQVLHVSVYLLYYRQRIFT